MSRTGPISMAGFQVIFYGRFWVITEASSSRNFGETLLGSEIPQSSKEMKLPWSPGRFILLLEHLNQGLDIPSTITARAAELSGPPASLVNTMDLSPPLGPLPNICEAVPDPSQRAAGSLGACASHHAASCSRTRAIARFAATTPP